MDSTDEKIIHLLRANCRMSFVDIAQKVGLTEGAVRARVKRLSNSGTIKKFTIETKDDVKAVVMVATSRSTPTSSVADEIKAMGIDKTYEISGNFDIICLIESDTIDNINGIVDKIRALQGVADTSTSMVLK
jgi:DNA-binding Lrp family transcriptional regulator